MSWKCPNCGQRDAPVAQSNLVGAIYYCDVCLPGMRKIAEYNSVSSGTGTYTDDRHIFSSGAMSSGKKPRYDLIPGYALERIARRFELGAEKYGVNNWKKGARDKDFILDRINHAIDHLLILKDRVHANSLSSDDDDAAAVVLNAIFVMEYERAEREANAASGR